MMQQMKKTFGFVLALVLVLGVLWTVPALAADNTAILARDAEWRYYDQGELTDEAWKTADFDDSAWAIGKAPLGFGDDVSETDPTLPIGTVIGFGDDPANKHMTSYFRTTVEVADLSGVADLEIYVHVDDGAVVYFNGVEAFRRGIDEGVEVVYDTGAKFKPKEETFVIPASLLQAGANIIAAEVHQDDGDSSDLWFELGITPVAAQSTGPAENLTVLARDAEWSYYDQGELTDASWKNVDFDDSAWATGVAPLGFGDDYSETDPSLPIGTVIGFGPDAADKYMTSYFRTTVEVPDLTGYAGLEIYVHVDDGAVIYVNGVEAFRKGIDEGIAVVYDTPAKFKPKEETFVAPIAALQTGTNVIAAEVHQDGGDSSDLWFELGAVALAAPKAGAAAEAVVTLPDPNAPLGEVTKVTITFAGDVLTAKGFTWYTTFASANSDLQVVEKTDAEPNFDDALKFAGRYQISTNSKTEVVHKAEAVGLKPSAEYYFRVGDESLNLWSATGSFATATADSAFTFINLADSQAKNEEEAILAANTFIKSIETVQDAEFMVINGDLVDTGMNEMQWDWLIGHGEEMFLNTTYMPIAGNHDEDKNSFYEHFDLVPAPFSATETGVYYSFDYKNAHFIMLNNNEDSPEYADFTPAQIQWLKGDAAAAKANGAEWLIAVVHKGPYTTSNHATDIDIMGANGVRTLVAPLLAQLDIDLVLQGHDHIYARSKPIVDGVAIDAEKITETFNELSIEYSVNPEGPIYLIPATAGPKVYYKNTKIDPAYYDLFDVADENHAAVYGPDPSDASRPVRSVIQNFVGITIDGNKLTAVTYEIDQNKDGNTPYIVDQFGIIK